MGVLHVNMQRNFSKYVADVEMQKLDLVIQNLAEVYAVYHDWGNAIQAQILQIEGEAAPDDYDRLSRWWLRRQYDIALQQRYFQEHSLANVNPSVVEPDPMKRQANAEELRWLELNLPSQFQPFEGLVFPLSANQNAFRSDRKNEGQNNTTDTIYHVPRLIFDQCSTVLISPGEQSSINHHSKLLSVLDQIDRVF